MRYVLSFFLIISSLAVNAQSIVLKYVAFNVPDVRVAAQWYHNTLGFTIVNEGKDTYVSDAGRNFRIRFFSDPTQKNNYNDISFNACHMAIETDDIHKWEQRVLQAGGKYNTDSRLNAIGDKVIDMRDPNGLMLQLISRVRPYYSRTPGAMRFEHLALNMSNNKEAALWYVEFMGLTIPWSKDPADSIRPVSNYRIPYVGDPGRNMAMEFLTTGDVRDYTKLGFEVSYVAFEVKNAAAFIKNMVRGGAKQIGEPHKSNGKIYIRVRCPWGNMLQVEQRVAW